VIGAMADPHPFRCAARTVLRDPFLSVQAQGGRASSGRHHVGRCRCLEGGNDRFSTTLVAMGPTPSGA
jgi:hypothetical protein